MLDDINKPERQITTDDLRIYLDNYQRRGTVSKVTLDNVRRILSSFFSWLEDEDYIIKSPVRRIHKVKTGKTVKETYTDEDRPLGIPSNFYVEVCKNGYDDFGFDKKYLRAAIKASVGGM